MVAGGGPRRIWEGLLSIGEYEGESREQRGKRRILVGVLVFSAPLILLGALSEVGEDRPLRAAVSLLTVGYIVGALATLRWRPGWFSRIMHLVFFLALLDGLVETLLLGGIEESSASILFGLLAVLGALVVFDVRVAFGWFIGFLVTVAAAVVVPDWVDPRYSVEGSSGELALNLALVSVLAFATLAYFVRQRDHFQQESDNLLRSILPDEIAARLKVDESMIADDYESASVLFADVVDFTPISAGMRPAELVGILNEVFTTFDGFVDELGMEKIKTIGDEYMAASGVPVARTDHAEAAAQLALSMRDYVENREFGGKPISLRIGIHSGPVVAGIIGARKFAYDLWGDTVNTASRMESAGVPGSIQVTEATYELIRARFHCEPRGRVPVKGKGEMETFFLLSKRSAPEPSHR